MSGVVRRFAGLAMPNRVEWFPNMNHSPRGRVMQNVVLPRLKSGTISSQECDGSC